MKFFPRYARWLELGLKYNLTAEERQELAYLDSDLQAFKAANPDFIPGGPLRATIGDLLRARR